MNRTSFRMESSKNIAICRVIKASFPPLIIIIIIIIIIIHDDSDF
jgi:hypothetical protein